MSNEHPRTYDPEQEIRFAVVLYGGASLAIYINGVAQELLRLVRSTADLPADEKLSRTEQIYRELGQLLGPGEMPASRPSGDDPVRTRFVVDIISGTSAGGINGVALAKALALKSKDLGVLKRTWLDEAQLDELLNDSSSDLDAYPPNPTGSTASLLNSERMYGKILETLRAMNPLEQRTPNAGAFADKLDLFVTATDLSGLSAPIQITGKKIDERIHRTVFHFEYLATGQAPDGQNANELNQFGPDFDPMLAFAARCTSSFPVAFEPMRFDRIEQQLKTQKIGLTVKEAEEKFSDFFPAYRVQNEDFVARGFADGGYLDNKPFSYAVDLIPYRSSDRPVRRKLLFVDPFPEIHEQRQSSRRSDVSFVDNAILAATTLPRYEVIRQDIRAVNAINRRLDRLFWLQQRVDEDNAQLGTRKELPSPSDFAGLDVKAMVEGEGYGDFYPRYHHLRVFDTTDNLAEIVTRLAGYETESDQYSFLREVLRAWREAHYSAYAVPRKETENAFLDRFDTNYRLRRLTEIRSVIDKKLRKRSDPSVKETLKSVRKSVELQLGRLREEVRRLASRTRSPLLRQDSPHHESLIALRRRLPDFFDAVMEQTGRTERHDAAVAIYQRQEIRPHVDALLNEVGDLLTAVLNKNREDMKAVLSLAEAAASLPAELRDVRKVYDTFHWHDALSLPFLEGSDATEHAEVGVYRVSPADSGLVPAYLDESGPSRAGKLLGTKVGAFGGFLKREWREHDMMWGRLDGAERIVTALLPDPLDQARRQEYIDRVHDAILAEEFSLADPRGRDRILEWLACRLQSKKTTDASAKDLIERGQELLRLFPTLQQVIDRGEFRTFLLRYYNPPPSPEPDRIASWSARSLKILGRMIEDLPQPETDWVRTRLANGFKFGGSLLTDLLRFATPESFGKKVSDSWLGIIALAGVPLILVGTFAGAPGIGLIGFSVLLACLGIWALKRAFTNWLRGRSLVRQPALVLIAILFGILAVLGIVKAWDIYSDVSQRTFNWVKITGARN